MLFMPITDATKWLARFWQDKIFAAGINDENNYTGLNEPDRYYTGYVGEICFRNLLILFDKRYVFKPRFDGYPDAHDFLVYLAGDPASLSLNVKTMNREFSTDVMMPESQFQKYRHDFYVGTRVLGDYAELAFDGWTTYGILAREKPRTHKNKILTRQIPRRKLRPIETLLEMIA